MTDTAVVAQIKGPAMALPAAQPDEGSAIIAMIERAARDPSVDLEKMERLYAMHERIEARRAEAEYAASMSECQREMEPIRKDANNPQTRSKYATYDALDRAVRPIYTKHGFEVSFDTGEAQQPEHIMVFCMITHKGGHRRIHRAPMPCDGKGAKGGDVMTKTHAMGSALQYGRRYTFGLGFNITTTERDDDGNRAGDTGEKISEDQADALRNLMDDFDSEQIAGFCKYFKVASIDDLPSAAFERAKAAIAKSKAKRVP
jgi:hypothetical protein